ncbi:beta-galactosidase [Bacteroidia bacterium]|nr:beta-galactosidase [Bacteroidia bacterium]
MASSTGVSAQQKHTFEIKDGNFVYDGKKTTLISGEMHYSRIPHQYWRHRLQMLRGMGLNAVATYVFWSFHEPTEGNWDFSGDRNLAEYIKIAGEEGLMVILRPGPYVCAEWEFGGYPWWLQNVPGLELRRDNEQFLHYTNLYFKKLYKEVGHLQITKGGPIIMVQAENEFGSYVAQHKDIPLQEHRTYNAKVVQQLADAGFNIPKFTSDGSWLFEGGAVAGALPTANGEGNIENLKKIVNEYHDGKGPYMVAEFYPGWLDHWAEPFPTQQATQTARTTEKYLSNDVSFNYYMVHGGTNFGFTTGANYDKNHDIQPDMTSYDYDAPITEAGWKTPKYDSCRAIIARYVDYKIPAPPAANPVIEIKDIQLKAVDMLAEIKALKPVLNDKPLTFEQLNQGHGYVLYSTEIKQPISGKLTIDGLRDYATVYVNGKKIGELNRYFKNYSLDIDIPLYATIDILVENMGRINYGANIIHNTKGIILPVKIGDQVIAGNWEMYQLPMDKVPALTKSAKAQQGITALYSGTFDLKKVGDTFIDMEDWGKGIIFINGINIGRYWKVGPQQTLYIPGVWLKKGKNEIVIFEQQNDKQHSTVSTVKVPVLQKLNLE